MTRETRCYVVLGLVLAIGVLGGLMGLGQTVDGPYYVVDVSSAQTDHVFNTIPGALAALESLPDVEEVVAATLIIYPGRYQVAGTLTITIPGLRIVTRDGANRTEIVAGAGFTPGPVIRINAPGVQIEGLTVSGAPGLNTVGIQVNEADCTLRDLVIARHDITGIGVQVRRGADRLLVSKCDVFGNAGAGVQLTGIWDARFENSTIRSNAGAGIVLTKVHLSEIVDSTVAGNGANAINIAACRDVVIKTCAIDSSGANGIQVANSTHVYVEENTFSANTGSAVLLNCTSSCVIANNTVSENRGTAVQITGVAANPSTFNRVEENSISLQAGALPPPIPAVPGILLVGAVQVSTVKDNQISGYMWGIVLDGLPRGNQIENNTVEATIADGIQVLGSGGDNVFIGNTITGCSGNGILVNSANDDLFEGNVVSGNTLSGFAINNPAALVWNTLTVAANEVIGNGVNGVRITSAPTPSPNTVANISLIDNTITGNDGIGVNIQGGGTATDLRIVGNAIAENEGTGLFANLCPGAVIRHNRIHENRGVGLQAATSASSNRVDLSICRNSISRNIGGGLNLILNPAAAVTGPVTVVEENAIYENLGFGAQVASLPVPPLALPRPQGFSLGSNWWGVSVGPSGLYAGTGNAVLGFPSNSALALAPILPAPAFVSAAVDASPILASPRVSVLNSFAAGKVIVDRLDTAGFRLTFTDVFARTTGWVSMAAYTEATIRGTPWSELGTVIKSAAILVSGLSDGMVEVACEFDAEALPDGVDPNELTLHAYKGGEWTVSEEMGEWTLTGGSWAPLSGCVTVGAQIAFGELPVTDLLGEVKAIALVATGPGASE